MKRFTAGVDVGATHTKVAVVDSEGRITKKVSFLTGTHKKAGLIKAIANALGGLLREMKIGKKRLSGMGVGVPGLVDYKKGLVFYFVNIAGWRNIPFKRLLEKETRLSCFVDNDVKVMALGEMEYGAAKGYKNAICLTLGTGVGGAVIIDGRLYRGSDMVAGEIGHIPIIENGRQCACGGLGCLEAYVGKDYFLKSVRSELRGGASSLALKLSGGKPSRITPELLMEAAHKGDVFARDKWREAAEHIATALKGVINLLNPELIVIGGGIAEAGSLLFRPLRKTVKQGAMRIQGKSVKILKAKLGNDAGVIGASVLVKQRLASRD